MLWHLLGTISPSFIYTIRSNKTVIAKGRNQTNQFPNQRLQKTWDLEHGAIWWPKWPFDGSVEFHDSPSVPSPNHGHVTWHLTNDTWLFDNDNCFTCSNQRNCGSTGDLQKVEIILDFCVAWGKHKFPSKRIVGRSGLKTLWEHKSSKGWGRDSTFLTLTRTRGQEFWECGVLGSFEHHVEGLLPTKL